MTTSPSPDPSVTVAASSGDPLISFPRRSAVTRGFRLGAPRSFTLAPDASRVVFLRSSAGDDPVNALWVLDTATGTEQQLLDPRTFNDADALTPEERARRERVREIGGGIVTYSTDADVRTAIALVGSSAVLVDLRNGRTEVLELGGPVVDPRLDPTGRRLAFVRDGRLHLHDLTGMASTAPVPVTPAEDATTVTWGLAEFVAAEEMDRTRGYWWAPDGTALLAARVDAAPVPVWWIADPADPASPATEQRYPQAGSTNADVTLHLVDPTGRIVPVALDEPVEYIAAAGWNDDGAWAATQSRDQRRLDLHAIERDGSARRVRTLTDDRWVELVAGAPRRHEGRWLTVEDDSGADTRRLAVDGAFVSPAGWQVRAIADTLPGAALVVAVPEGRPAEQALVEVGLDGDWRPLDTGTPWVSGRGAADLRLRVEQSLSSTRSRALVSRAGTTIELRDLSETPSVHPDPDLLTVPTPTGPMRVAVLRPSAPVDGPLPVLMDPYGGPHGQRVAAAGAAFTTAQWWADQGFVVVVADGRGTPGSPSWEKSVHLDLASGVLADQVAALDAVEAAHPDLLDRTRVGIRGWSFGGYLAALAVLDRPDVFTAAVAGAPVTEWRLYDTHYTERYLGDPRTTDGAAVYDANSLLTRAAALTRPLLLIHGLADDNVVAAHTLQLSSALLAAGRPHDMLPLSGVTHMTPQEVVAENLLLLQLEFLRRHLG